jgi:hypothetical protein
MNRPFIHKLLLAGVPVLGFLIAGFVLLNASEGQDEAPAPAQSPPEIHPPVFVSEEAALFLGEDDDTHLDKMPPRLIMGLDLKRMGWSYDCMECHKHVEDSRFDRNSLKVEHENIHLEHGNNRYCLNCHHPENRNAFVDYDGTEISERDVTLLCAKCHGPKYRDWKAGVHGRQNGFWDATKGIKTKLRCIQCHDPHMPNFPDIEPLAPPTYPKRAAKADSSHHSSEDAYAH